MAMVSVRDSRRTELQRAEGVPPTMLPRMVRAGLNGALGGMLGTLLMSAGMLAARSIGLVGRLPPERIIQKALFPGLRQHQHTTAKNALALVFHFGFGAAGGTFFGLVYRRLPLARYPAVQGVIYGTLIWFVSYMGWAPALGLMPPAQRDRRDRPIIMVLVHWIYGTTLGVVVGWLARRGAAGTPAPSAATD
jgi:uncharacterized membrane protein YagU involved in acid resistance